MTPSEIVLNQFLQGLGYTLEDGRPVLCSLDLMFADGSISVRGKQLVRLLGMIQGWGKKHPNFLGCLAMTFYMGTISPHLCVGTESLLVKEQHCQNILQNIQKCPPRLRWWQELCYLAGYPKLMDPEPLQEVLLVRKKKDTTPPLVQVDFSGDYWKLDTVGS